mgnify:CR=1 FL=1
MTRLNQLLAAAKDVKTSTFKQITEAYRTAQKPQLFAGQRREYQPNDEDGEKLPGESQLVQQRVAELHADVRKALGRLWQLVATIDATNRFAVADVKIGERVLLEKVPAVHLLFLEKQLNDLRDYLTALPTLDTTSTWSWDRDAGLFRSDTVKTARSRKVPEVVVLYPATDKHPAQTQLIQRDELAGYWSTTKLSGGIPVTVQRTLLERLGEIQRAVKSAREEANMATVVDFDSAPLLEYLFSEE